VEHFSDGAIRLMRAIRRRHSDPKAGTAVNPYLAAYAATRGPLAPWYDAALRELLSTEVLRRSPLLERDQVVVEGGDQDYEITLEGEWAIILITTTSGREASDAEEGEL